MGQHTQDHEVFRIQLYHLTVIAILQHFLAESRRYQAGFHKQSLVPIAQHRITARHRQLQFSGRTRQVFRVENQVTQTLYRFDQFQGGLFVLQLGVQFTAN